MLCAGCTSAPPAPTPVIVHNACPKVSLCPMPGSDPQTNGDLSADNPAPSASADALHIRFPDGAVIEYEPETSALTVSGIKTASVTASDSVTATVPVVMVKASTRVTLDTPEVVCTNRLITGTLEVQKGGTMRGNIEHTGGELSSNGKVLHTHKHPGDSGGKIRSNVVSRLSNRSR
nr:Rz1-like lysis system protein LysC [Escherichia coli]